MGIGVKRRVPGAGVGSGSGQVSEGGRPRFAFALALLVLPSWAPLGAEPRAGVADVVVYGSTPGGFCAAIAAAREGAKVILLEPTDHIGGLSTGGLSHCDSNQMARATVMGLFDEWHSRIVEDYTRRGSPRPYDPRLKDQSRWTFEPHVAMRVTRAMLDEAGVQVLTDHDIRSVSKSGARIRSVDTKGGMFTARVFIDGSYEGDLMAAAGVEWTIGREGREEYGESLAGKQYPKAKMDISGFDDRGRLLPLVTTADAGPEASGDGNVMTYSFRLCLTADPDNQLPVPEPANYDPARFEIARRAIGAGARVGFDLYPLPGGKLDGNNSIGGQISLGLVGGGNRWHSADEEGRRRIWEQHKQYTLEFIRFLKTDPAVQAGVRERYSKLGLCKDEFVEHGGFPPALYVRESRRMKGMYVIRQRDILETPEKPDPIAISSFPIDSHDCQRVALAGGGVINEGTIFPVRKKNPKQGYAYHVPYRAVLPKPGQADNLLVPVALSCTHVGISSLRIEGTWMIIGQSAGIAAAMAVRRDCKLHELPYPELRRRLLAHGQVLELPEPSANHDGTAAVAVESLPGIVLDDQAAELEGRWSPSTHFKPFIGRGYLFAGDRRPSDRGSGRVSATLRTAVPETGAYRLGMAYSAHETRSTAVPVTVRQGGRTTTFEVDQTQPLPAGERFRGIGRLDLVGGKPIEIVVSDAGSEGFLILDAFQLLPIED